MGSIALTWADEKQAVAKAGPSVWVRQVPPDYRLKLEQEAACQASRKRLAALNHRHL